mmetsp:Transcript_22022/g.44821  ORF Transcript_22022/g.44821 Transcript_22022/m.44821 type:complete len:244 (+) Transcript_22022:127-858(+)
MSPSLSRSGAAGDLEGPLEAILLVDDQRRALGLCEGAVRSEAHSEFLVLAASGHLSHHHPVPKVPRVLGDDKGGGGVVGEAGDELLRHHRVRLHRDRHQPRPAHLKLPVDPRPRHAGLPVGLLEDLRVVDALGASCKDDVAVVGVGLALAGVEEALVVVAVALPLLAPNRLHRISHRLLVGPGLALLEPVLVLLPLDLAQVLARLRVDLHHAAVDQILLELRVGFISSPSIPALVDTVVFRAS